MPGGPHHMRTKKSSTGACLLNSVVGSVLHPQADCPFCSRVILGLDCAQPLYHIAGLFTRSLGDELIVKALVRNVQVCHGCSLYRNQVSLSLVNRGRTPACPRPAVRVLPWRRNARLVASPYIAAH